MKTISLGGHEMLVDDDFVVKGRLRVGRTGYAEAHLYAGFDRTSRRTLRSYKLVHRMVVDAPAGMEVDHINGNRLDNRRANLRLCTRVQNAKNRPSAKGVTWHKQLGKWQASIKADGRNIYLGVFADFGEALQVRRAAELQYFGEYAPVRSA